jgi:DNA-binding transcriptional MerR regulator
VREPAGGECRRKARETDDPVTAAAQIASTFRTVQVLPRDPHVSAQHLRIGEFSRRVGVDADLLRSWERRYGLTSPARTAGGLRLYGPEETQRVSRMVEHLRDGLSAAEAARLTRREFDTPDHADATDEVGTERSVPATVANPMDLGRALDQLDEDEANRVFDRLLGALSLSTVVRAAVLPYLRELGERWLEEGDAVIAQEHFATAVLRGRLLGLARGWGAGYGPAALLACFPDDHHDLGLICFGLALREKGWRITFLGANTPLASIEALVTDLRPALTVLTRAMPGPDPPAVEQTLRRIARTTTLALAGPGVGERLAHADWARYLSDDPFTAAHKVAVAIETDHRHVGLDVGSAPGGTGA